MNVSKNTIDLLPVYGSLLVAGLAASLHCIGMCGPILLGFAEAFGRTPLTVHGQPVAQHGRGGGRDSLAWDFALYHMGRLWTYALLGFGAGWVGRGVRGGSAYLGIQFTLAVAVSVAVIVTGLAMFGVIPTGKIKKWLSRCGAGLLHEKNGLVAFTRHQGNIRGDVRGKVRGWVGRLLLGVVMGFLPCGLVYGVLLIVAAMPTPWHSALGMVVFGLGTLPSLTGVLAVRRLVPLRYRAYGTRLAGVLIVATGAWMITRTVVFTPRGGDGGAGASCHQDLLDGVIGPTDSGLTRP